MLGLFLFLLFNFFYRLVHKFSNDFAKSISITLSTYALMLSTYVFTIYFVSTIYILLFIKFFSNSFRFLYRQLIQEGTLDEMVIIVNYFAFNLASCFVFCYFGEQLTTECSGIERSINETFWYLMPIQVTKKLPTMIAMTQRPICIKGFAKISCTYEFFKRVFHFMFLVFCIRF